MESLVASTSANNITAETIITAAVIIGVFSLFGGVIMGTMVIINGLLNSK